MKIPSYIKKYLNKINLSCACKVRYDLERLMSPEADDVCRHCIADKLYSETEPCDEPISCEIIRNYIFHRTDDKNLLKQIHEEILGN